MAENNNMTAGEGAPDRERRAVPRPLKRWHVVVRGTAAMLVKESPREEVSDGSLRAPSWKGRISERRRTA